MGLGAIGNGYIVDKEAQLYYTYLHELSIKPSCSIRKYR